MFKQKYSFKGFLLIFCHCWGRNIVAFCQGHNFCPSFLELTHCPETYYRWKDLSETSGETIAHDSQTPDSGPEGPDEPGRPENQSSPSGRSGCQPLAFLAGEVPELKTITAFHKGKTTQHSRALVVVCVFYELKWIDYCLLVSTVMDDLFHYYISLSSDKAFTQRGHCWEIRLVFSYFITLIGIYI